LPISLETVRLFIETDVHHL